MDTTKVKICDILKTEYPDFCAYCESSGKVFVSELSNVDFVAFRSRMEKSREYIVQLKAFIDKILLSNECDLESVVNNDTVDLQNKNQDNKNVNNECDGEAAVEFVEKDQSYALHEHQQHADTLMEQKFDKLEKQNFFHDNTIGYDESLPLSSIFEIEPSYFSDVPLDVLNLGVRSFNCLKRSGCKLLGDLLLKTISDLRSIRNMGFKSVDEIFEKVKEYVSMFYDGLSYTEIQNTQLLPSSMISEGIINAIESILLGKNIPTDVLDTFNENQIVFLERINESVEVLGREICAEAYSNSQYMKKICESLEAFADPIVNLYSTVESVYESIWSLPLFIKDRKVVPFINAYVSKTGKDLSPILSVCDITTTIYQLLAFKNNFNNLKIALFVKEFISWIDIDVHDTIEKTISQIKEFTEKSKERAIEVFNLRTSGKTLEETGNIVGVTRERVRQLELKMYAKFWKYYYAQNYDLIMLIYALKDGDNILFLDDLKEFLGDFALVLWNMIKHVPENQLYFYSKEIDAIVIQTGSEDQCDKDLIDNAHEALDMLPNVLEASQIEEELEKVSDKCGLPFKVVKKLFYNSYRKTGEFYSENAITVVFMCEYVLKQRFPAGFKTGDTYESDRFRKYMIELFGERA
ncbi:MAG: hypothetical protein K5756_05045 [Clostridiales bacterium]|nr:hypothetical protein [Clostridiales bacterium]